MDREPPQGILAGKVALVTGATSGLGRHFARVLARAGARVVATGRRADALASLGEEVARDGGRCHGVSMEVTDPASVQAGFDEAAALAG
ncbi:SDR family NAD(P)-dependent oxidoreductase, partial [Arenibaculum sp.]|uniref:SDR family NAD(P)-dependent oxidoreductase n=1 Tax=Arenibaculum sp. TaxID=2865862 RepID=UPI002E0E49D6|nr:SDR family NAD(P)-dependent oxidoreductase [Arenibaculum sp.]